MQGYGFGSFYGTPVDMSGIVLDTKKLLGELEGFTLVGIQPTPERSLLRDSEGVFVGAAMLKAEQRVADFSYRQPFKHCVEFIIQSEYKYSPSTSSIVGSSTHTIPLTIGISLETFSAASTLLTSLRMKEHQVLARIDSEKITHPNEYIELIEGVFIDGPHESAVLPNLEFNLESIEAYTDALGKLDKKINVIYYLLSRQTNDIIGWHYRDEKGKLIQQLVTTESAIIDWYLAENM